MYSYALLEPWVPLYYPGKEDSPIAMIKVNFESDHCVYVSKYEEALALEWKKKTDPILDIIELLSDDKVKAWDAIYNNNEDAYYEEDE